MGFDSFIKLALVLVIWCVQSKILTLRAKRAATQHVRCKPFIIVFYLGYLQEKGHKKKEKKKSTDGLFTKNEKIHNS